MLASRSHRIELIACVAALGGCMKIYPDPELPDVEVEWYDIDCRDGEGDVALTLIGVDDTTLRNQLTVPCSDLKATFKDVARQRYMLEGSLLDDTGVEFNRSPQMEIDLRNGIDEIAYLYFGGFSNFRIEWTFDMGATCGSLAVDGIQIEFATEGQALYHAGTYCQGTPHFGSAPDGIYTVTVRATANGTTVAVSPELPDVLIDFDTFSDLGTVVLTPCGGDCP
jgi:hypothetical protein